jgi:hypothetical protein
MQIPIVQGLSCCPDWTHLDFFAGYFMLQCYCSGGGDGLKDLLLPACSRLFEDSCLYIRQSAFDHGTSSIPFRVRIIIGTLISRLIQTAAAAAAASLPKSWDKLKAMNLRLSKDRLREALIQCMTYWTCQVHLSLLF